MSARRKRDDDFELSDADAEVVARIAYVVAQRVEREEAERRIAERERTAS